jgi:type I restriction enzyme, S subunit
MKTLLLYDAIDHISGQGAREGSQLVGAGTVFIVVRGMILAHTFPVGVAMRQMAFNQDMKGIVCNGLVSPMYLAYWFTSQAHRLLTLTSETSHGTKRIDTRLIWRFPIAVPPAPEQERMVNLLQACDRQIDSFREIEVRQQRLKRGLMQVLLTGKRRVGDAHGTVKTQNLLQV